MNQPQSGYRRVTDGAIHVELPATWDDITDELEGTGYPWTLARPDGGGALQFSVALYRSGVLPQPTTAELMLLLEEWASGRGAEALHSIIVEGEPILLAAASFELEDRAWRAWYLSQNGRFALATYNCEIPMDDDELQDCERIVRTLGFNEVPD